MWENRCKVAVSGVGFSKITRSAEVPLTAHALQAVQAAVEDSGLAMADIDGLATYAELPASGHAIVDGISIVSVNCMMAMLKLPHLSWHVQVETVNIGGAVQQAVNALLAGVCTYAVVWRAMHNPRGTYQNLPAFTRRVRLSLRHPTASVVRGRAWPSPIPAGSSGTTRTARRWRHWR